MSQTHQNREGEHSTLDKYDPMRKVERDRIVRIFIRLPEPVKIAARKAAKAKRLSLQDFVIHVLIDYLKRQP